MDEEKLQEMERHLGLLKTYLEAEEVEAEVLPADDKFALPTLIAVINEDENDNQRVAIVNYVMLDEIVDQTDFIQFYVELPLDCSAYADDVLHTTLNDLNRKLPVGFAFVVAPRPDMTFAKMVGLRYMFPFPKGSEISEGVFIDALFMFDMSCEAVVQRFAEM